jgi:hypothetical protein
MIIRQSTREVEDNGAESACRGIANTACTRCTEAINTRYREEMRLRLLLLLEVVVIVVGEDNSWLKKDESAAAEEQKRGTVR